jgi:hypothetical protein
MAINRIANRIKAGNLILVFKRDDGGLWLDAELQPTTSYGYPIGRVVEYAGFGGMDWERLQS